MNSEHDKCNVYLVGLMGAGKTTIGRALARRLAYRFIDSDHEIEARTGQPLTEDWMQRFYQRRNQALQAGLQIIPGAQAAVQAIAVDHQRGAALADGAVDPVAAGASALEAWFVQLLKDA